MKFLPSFMALLMICCAPEIRVYTDHDPDYEIKAFQTFDWAQKTNIEDDRNPLYYNELNDKRIKTAVMKELQSRNYVYTEETPEMLIHYHIIMDDMSVVAQDYDGHHYGPYWTRARTHIYAYREGTLIVDIMDAKTDDLIWRGWAVSPMDVVYTPDETEKLINRSIEKIFRNFPTRAENKPVALNLPDE